MDYNLDEEFTFLPPTECDVYQLQSEEVLQVQGEEDEFHSHSVADPYFNGGHMKPKAEPLFGEEDGYHYSHANHQSMDLDDSCVPMIGGMSDDAVIPSIKYETIPSTVPASSVAIAVPVIPVTAAIIPSSTLPAATVIRATAVKQEPLSPLLSTMSSNCSSAGSNSGSNSGNASECSDSDSDAFDESASQTGKRGGKGSKKSSPKTAGRKRKNKASNSDGGSSNDQIDDGDLDGGLDGSLQCDMTGMPLTGDKKAQRLQRNRASAQLSRERKKQYVRLLEKQLKDMAELNEGLTVQVTALTTENTTLKARLAKLVMRERVQARYPPRTPASVASSHQSMPSLQQHSPSDGDSQFSSAPATPSTAEADDAVEFSHPAKKLKVQAYASPSSSPSSAASTVSRSSSGGGSGGSIRASMLLFTLVMSVGLFYNLVGLDQAPMVTTRPNTPSTVTIEPMEEISNSVSTVRELVTLPARNGRVLTSISEESIASAASPPTSSVVVSEEDAFALVPIASKMDVDEDVNTRALDVYSGEKAGSSSSIPLPLVASSSKVHESQTHRFNLDGFSLNGLSDLSVHLLRELYVQGNLTHDDSSKYIFAPQALRITNSFFHGLMNSKNATVTESARRTPSEILEDSSMMMEEEEKSLALFDSAGRVNTRGKKRDRNGLSKKSTAGRLRHRLPAPTASGAAALPAPNQSYAEHQELLNPSASLQVGDKLLLWLPLAGPSSGMPGSKENETQSHGLVEIACHIANVRPIVLS